MKEPQADSTYNLHFRIIACKRLLKGDVNSSDPYVKIMLGTKELHRTKAQSKTLNPIFGEEDEHRFSAKINYGELTEAGGLGIEVKDWNLIGTNDLIGLGNIEPARVLELAKIGNPTTIKLEVPEGREETEAGFITLCIQDIGVKKRRKRSASPKRKGTSPKSPKKRSAGSKKPSSDSEEALGSVAPPLPDMGVSTPVAEEQSKKLEPLSADSTFDLIFRIVSCRKLLIGDRVTASSDPYVKVMLGTKELHRTKVKTQTLNPVFHEEEENTFVAKINYGELTEAGGVGIEVKDWNLIRANDLIGVATIKPDRLLELAKIGKPTAIPLDTPEGWPETEADAGLITLHIHDAGDGLVSDDDWDSDDEFFVPMPKLDFRIPEAGRDAPPTYDKEILIEILGCKNLIAADMNGLSDPYVEILLGGKLLHTTHHVYKTLNPAYSVDQKNIYFLRCSARELWDNHGIKLKVKDYDSILAIGVKDDDLLGYVQLSPKMLYEAEGAYKEFKLIRPSGHELDSPSESTITVRLGETKLRDKDEQAAAEAVSKDDGQEFDSFSVVKGRPYEKVYTGDAESVTESSDVYLEHDTGTSYIDVPRRKVPQPNSRSPPVAPSNPVGVASKMSLVAGDLFQLELDEFNQKKEMAAKDSEYNELLTPELTVEQMAELLYEKDERIRNLEKENDALKKENKVIRVKLKKNRYILRTKFAYEENKEKKFTKIPLARKPEETKGDEGPTAKPSDSSKDGKEKKAKKSGKKGKKEKKKRKGGLKSPKKAKKRVADLQSIEEDESVSSFDSSIGSDDEEEWSSERRLLKMMCLTDSVVQNESVYSFVKERSQEEEKTEDDPDELPDFDRKHKDMEFAKLDFAGTGRNVLSLPQFDSSADIDFLAIANMIDQATSIDGVQRLSFVSQMLGQRSSMSMVQGRDSALNMGGSSYDHTTRTTTTTQMANAMTPDSARRIAQLEREVIDLKEELELANANPGLYDKAAMEVQLKLAQELNSKLTAKVERLETFNRIQTHTMMLTVAQGM